METALVVALLGAGAFIVYQQHEQALAAQRAAAAAAASQGDIGKTIGSIASTLGPLLLLLL